MKVSQCWLGMYDATTIFLRLPMARLSDLLKKLDAPLKFMDARLENLDALLMHWCIGGAVDAWLENLDASVVPWAISHRCPCHG